MSSELAKTISTTAIWLSTAVILTFGVCRIGEGETLSLCLCVVVIGATVATAVIWAPWKLRTESDRRGFEVLPAESNKD